MAEVATTVVSSIAAQRKPFYTWLVPGVFYSELGERDAASLVGRRVRAQLTYLGGPRGGRAVVQKLTPR